MRLGIVGTDIECRFKQRLIVAPSGMTRVRADRPDSQQAHSTAQQ